MIVALTANASDEDRARYLACGMDGFLTKPIDEDALHFHLARAIERQLQRGIALEPFAQPARPAPSAAELDAMFGVFTGPAPLGQAAAGRQGDLNARLRTAFAADLPRRRAELDAALAAGDAAACALVLHGLRGSAGYLGEAALAQLCGELEAAAEAGNVAAVREAMPGLAGLLDAIASAAA
jgi:HPt (histidine-containing phosphotransfer) domain-containing protein